MISLFKNDLFKYDAYFLLDKDLFKYGVYFSLVF